MTEDAKVRWHHRFNAHEFEQGPGDGERQGSLASGVHGVRESWTQLATEQQIKQNQC